MPRRMLRAFGIQLGGIFWLLAGLSTCSSAQVPVVPGFPREQFVRVDKDVSLEVLDWGGKGRPVVLLAGLGDTAHVFDQFAPKLTDAYHVYGITRRGFGRSSAPHVGYDAARLGEDVYQVLIALKLSGPVLAGHSIAGEELSAVGARHPDSVAGLIYLDAAGDPTSPPKTRPEPDRDHSGDLLPEQPRGIPGQFTSPTQAVMDGVEKPDYEHIRAPALAIFAVARSASELIPGVDANTDAATRAKAERLFVAFNRRREAIERSFKTEVSNSQVIELRGATHYVFLSNESDVLREMRRFLGSLP